MFLLVLNSIRLHENIPSLENLKKQLCSAYDNLIKVLGRWRDRRICTLEKCHSAVVEEVNAALVQATQQVLDKAATSTSNPLEEFLWAQPRDMNLMKAEIEECKAAIAKACVLDIASDLVQVREIFCQEEAAMKCEACDALEAKRATFAEQAEEYRKQLDEVTKKLNEAIENHQSETSTLRHEIRVLKSQEVAQRQSAAKHAKLIANLKQGIRERDALISRLQSQLNLETTLRLDTSRSQLSPIPESVSVEDVEDFSLSKTPSVKLRHGKKPNVRDGTMRRACWQDLKWTCSCQTENESTLKECSNCGHCKARNTVTSMSPRSEIPSYYASDEVSQYATRESLTREGKSPRMHPKTANLFGRRIELGQKFSQKPEEEEKSPGKEAES